MRWSLLVWVLATAALVNCRDAKWFLTRNTVTRYVFRQPEPSSCIVMYKSLKPCRYLRHIDASPTTSSPLMTSSARLSERTPPLRQVPPLLPQAPSWSLLEPVTVVHTVAARAHTPLPVVTFSVRGCHPSRLPFDLNLCPIDGDQKQN